MRTKFVILALLILLSSLLLSACDIGGASASLGAITPVDTSASTLQVTVGITEDQDATDGRSNMTFQFRSALVEEDNLLHFAHSEAVRCNGVTLQLGDAPLYTLSVPRRGGYTCSYTGYTQGTGQLTPITMIDVSARSSLAPQQPFVGSQGYTIGYTPDASGRACSMAADAIDGADAMISGYRLTNKSAKRGGYASARYVNKIAS